MLILKRNLKLVRFSLPTTAFLSTGLGVVHGLYKHESP